MNERLRLLKPVRNLTAAAAISLLPTSTAFPQNIPSQSFGENRIELEDVSLNSSKDSILEQVDEMVETDYGKAFAFALFAFSLLNTAYRLQKGLELDTKREYGFNIISSASLLALTSSLVAQTETDMDPGVTATFLTTFALANTAYSIDTTLEADRSWYKRVPSIGAVSAMLTANIIILANTIDKT